MKDKKARVIPDPPPRYDDVYDDAVRCLDSEAITSVSVDRENIPLVDDANVATSVGVSGPSCVKFYCGMEPTDFGKKLFLQSADRNIPVPVVFELRSRFDVSGVVRAFRQDLISGSPVVSRVSVVLLPFINRIEVTFYPVGVERAYAFLSKEIIPLVRQS